MTCSTQRWECACPPAWRWSLALLGLMAIARPAGAQAPLPYGVPPQASSHARAGAGQPATIPAAAGPINRTAYQAPGYQATPYQTPTGYQPVTNYPVQPAQAVYPQPGYPPGYPQATYPAAASGPMMAPPGTFSSTPVSPGYSPPLVGQAAAPPGPMPVGQPFVPPLTNAAPAVAGPDPIPVRDAVPASVQDKVVHYISDVIEPEVRLDIEITRGTLIRTKHPIERMSITHPGIVDTIQYHPNEFELVGRELGETTLTLWFPDNTVPAGKKPYIRYLIRVKPTERKSDDVDFEYGKLQRRVNELFPNSHVQLIPVLDKLIVRGQARDEREAAQIMQMVGDQAIDQFGSTMGYGGFRGGAGLGYGGGYGAGFGYGGISGGGAIGGTGWGAGYGGLGNRGLGGALGNRNAWGYGMAANEVINMLDVPGEKQVMLKVRVAELTRTALRQMGANFTGIAGDFTFSSVLNVQGAATAVLTSNQVQFAISALSGNKTSKMLAEPNLVTLSGFPASFIAGGTFAVPTVVGVGGAAAATTGFQGYGTQIAFTPTVLDRDHIRLQVTPTVSRLDGSSVNGIPGLNVRSAQTTVDLREGQWLAIAGLIQDQQTGEKVRVPWLGDIPILDMIFSRKEIHREETEVVILVSPELVHPMEADQVPQILPGMEVTEPDDAAFFIRGRYEGHPDHQHRSTVWPVYRFDTYDARNRAIRDAKGSRGYMGTERYYMKGPYGFCN